MSNNKFIGHRLSKRSEHLFLSLLLVGYSNYQPAYLANKYKQYYVIRPNKYLTCLIFIHKHKAKYHTSALPSPIKRITSTKITNNTLRELIDLSKLVIYHDQFSNG